MSGEPHLPLVAGRHRVYRVYGDFTEVYWRHRNFNPLVAEYRAHHDHVSIMAEQVVDSDDDTPQLSAHALAALQEFYTDRLVQEQQTAARKVTGAGPVEIQEDWVKT